MSCAGGAWALPPRIAHHAGPGIQAASTMYVRTKHHHQPIGDGTTISPAPLAYARLPARLRHGGCC